MRGWSEVDVPFREGRTTWQCEAPLCKAYVVVREGDDRRRQHDREFHLLRTERGGGINGGYTLHLDGEQIGDVYDKIERYNLRRVYVTHQWVARLDGRSGRTMRSLYGGPKFGESMMQFVREIEGAKAWGQGKNPSAWLFPDEVSR